MAAPQPSQPRSLCTDFEVLSYINSLMEVFKSFDSNNDGLITSDELRGVLGSLGYNTSEREVKEMMRQGDTDRDGLLSLHEFLEINTRELDLGDLADLLQAAVPALGREVGNDEAVTGEELYNVLGSTGSASMEDCMDIIACLDGDGDGAVSLEDLQCIVQALL
ncbi:probable calcium-binding protein CML29 [Phoenix dactylifera]|uniref:Probable calcium-binding protein CML29 n=1 Tax=Phoenix dactylifera TaxID=42345 RepID=A0A8B7CPF7_PHODC|nr:probable calcium-binding protein CML29 [Phoenix dactylifera]